jgi:hypothetical protein
MRRVNETPRFFILEKEIPSDLFYSNFEKNKLESIAEPRRAHSKTGDRY